MGSLEVVYLEGKLLGKWRKDTGKRILRITIKRTDIEYVILKLIEINYGMIFLIINQKECKKGEKMECRIAGVQRRKEIKDWFIIGHTKCKYTKMI